MAIVTALHRARHNAGARLSVIAERSGVGVTNLSAIENLRRGPTMATVDRIADALGVTFVAVSVRGRSSAADTAQAIAQSETQGDVRLSYRQFIQLADDLATADPVTKVLLSAEEPLRDGGRWYDAIAALVEYRLKATGAPIPVWVANTAGQRDDPWEPQRSAPPLPFPADISEVAEPFLRRGILIEANEFESA